MGGCNAEELRDTLVATLEVVSAQRSRIDCLHAELRAVQDSADELRAELSHEREAHSAAETKLREVSVDFARRLSAMQARVLQAERDVVLGGQVLVTHSAPPADSQQEGASHT